MLTTSKVLTNNFNATNLVKPNNKNIVTQVISRKRFAAKGAYSQEFVDIVKSFSKTFWDVEQKCWTLPLEAHELFVARLKENQFTHQNGNFYIIDIKFKNKAVIRLMHSDKLIGTHVKDIFHSDKENTMFLNIEYFTKCITQLINDMYKLEGKLEFDNSVCGFVFIGKLSVLVDFLKANFFDTTFQYIDKRSVDESFKEKNNIKRQKISI